MFCANSTASDPQGSGHDYVEKDEAKEDPVIHWGYSGPHGPSKWGHLSGDYALCRHGKRQSPVNLHRSDEYELYPLAFQYSAVPLQVINNGHTLQANYNKVNELKVSIGGQFHQLSAKPVYQSKLMLGTVPYELLQFHFHSPSEHSKQGKRYAMEAHLVHKAADGNLAVVGIFLELGKHNPTLQSILDNLSDTINEVAVVKDTQVNALHLLPKKRKFYHYSGSLTTPPCSENVNWFVMMENIDVSAEQVNRFTRLVGENARPLQPIHWRTLLISK